MTPFEWCKRMRLTPSAGQIAAFRYLERKGLAFLVDYGMFNAEGIARGLKSAAIRKGLAKRQRAMKKARTA